MKALIFDGRVVDRHATGFPVAPDMQWVDAPDDVTAGDAFDGVTFLKSPPPGMDEATKSTAKLQQIDLQSIRAIREFVAALPNAPKAIKDIEAEAQAERSKVKK